MVPLWHQPVNLNRLFPLQVSVRRQNQAFGPLNLLGSKFSHFSERGPKRLVLTCTYRLHNEPPDDALCRCNSGLKMAKTSPNRLSAVRNGPRFNDAQVIQKDTEHVPSPARLPSVQECLVRKSPGVRAGTEELVNAEAFRVTTWSHWLR